MKFVVLSNFLCNSQEKQTVVTATWESIKVILNYSPEKQGTINVEMNTFNCIGGSNFAMGLVASRNEYYLNLMVSNYYV